LKEDCRNNHLLFEFKFLSLSKTVVDPEEILVLYGDAREILHHGQVVVVVGERNAPSSLLLI
jgi:hypothetical protein